MQNWFKLIRNFNVRNMFFENVSLFWRCRKMCSCKSCPFSKTHSYWSSRPRNCFWYDVLHWDPFLNCINVVGTHGGRRENLVPFLVVLSFSKLQTFLNNIPEGNPLKSMYLTPKIAFTFRPMWSLNGRVAYIYLSTFSQ